MGGRLKSVCAYCGGDITAADDSEEHVIPAAIGGRRTVRGLLHGLCNNRAGYTWDAALEKQLRPLALHFGVKRQRGRTLRMAVTTTAGEAFLLGPSGVLDMARPEITRTATPQGENIQVVVGSMRVARQVLEGERRKNPAIDVDATLATAQVKRSYAQGVVRLDLGFGGELAGRSLVKSALALAHDAGHLLISAATHWATCARPTASPASATITPQTLSVVGARACPCTASPSRQARGRV